MLQHVSLEVRPEDTERCVGFWRLVGFERVNPPGTLAGRATWLQRGRTQIHLLHTDDPHVPPEGHAAVVVDDYERTIQALRDDGFDPEPRREHWGARRSFVRDPVGHRVELMAAPPPM
jgi:catechol 2,3-dioxygenase-like lactoylglutathione lyase family enzyme